MFFRGLLLERAQQRFVTVQCLKDLASTVFEKSVLKGLLKSGNASSTFLVFSLQAMSVPKKHDIIMLHWSLSTNILSNKNATARLLLSTVISRLDYCNATFAGISSEQMLRLQRILNHAARLAMKRSKRDHVTPLLKELHWLPVQCRSQYKLAILAYRHFDGSLPHYLSSCLCPNCIQQFLPCPT